MTRSALTAASAGLVAVLAIAGCGISGGGLFGMGRAESSFRITKNAFKYQSATSIQATEYCVAGDYKGSDDVTIVLLRSVDGGPLEQVKGEHTFSSSHDPAAFAATYSQKGHNTFQDLKKGYKFEVCDWGSRTGARYRLVVWTFDVGMEHPEKLKVIVESDSAAAR